MSNVTKFPMSSTMTPEMVFECALEMKLQDTVVIGYDEHGEVVVLNSRMTSPEALWLVKGAEVKLFQ